MCFYGFLLCKILEILQLFQYTEIYGTMENVGIALFYRIFVLAAIITMRLLTLDILYGDENLKSIFNINMKSLIHFAVVGTDMGGGQFAI